MANISKKEILKNASAKLPKDKFKNRDLELLFKEIFENISLSVSKADDVTITNFGKFCLNDSKEIVFKPSKKLRDLIIINDD